MVDTRLAQTADLETIGLIARESMLLSYGQLVRADALRSWIDSVYSPETLVRRWDDHPMYVVDGVGGPISFADVFVEDGRIFLSALFTHPDHRRCGAAGALVGQVRRIAAQLPVTCDVLLGNADGERFFEALGFVPGETLRVTMFGEPVVERRWYLDPLVDRLSSSSGGATAWR